MHSDTLLPLRARIWRADNHTNASIRKTYPIHGLANGDLLDSTLLVPCCRQCVTIAELNSEYKEGKATNVQ